MNAVNGNGRRAISLQDFSQSPQVPEELTCQARLRDAVFSGVTESDAQEIVKSIVAQAKSGDSSAQKMFFDYVLGAKTSPQNVTVNVVADVETAAKIAAKANGKELRA